MESRLQALEALLDDTSPLVRDAVIEEVKRLGEPALAWLESLVTKKGSQVADAAEEILGKTAGPGATSAFIRYVRGAHVELEQGAILLQRAIYPRLDPVRVSGALDEIAQRVQDLIAIPTTSALVVRAINRVLYHELGYRGEPNVDPDPGTVLLGDVLALRRGIDLSLGLLYILVARRLGMEFLPVFLPNRMLLAHLRDREPFLVDPFSRGRFFTWAEAQAMVPVGAMIDLQRYWEKPAEGILRLTCERLASIYSSRSDAERAATFTAFCEEFGETSQESPAS